MTNPVSKARVAYSCSECGWVSPKWVGRCGECQQWGSVDQVGRASSERVAAVIPLTKALPITEVALGSVTRCPLGISEFDRVLGGGLVPGSVALLAGEPGVGKSTLLLEAAARWADTGARALYVSGEESVGQVRLRAVRTGAERAELFLASETELGAVLGHIDQVEPSLVIVDSVQTISSASCEGASGGVAQVKEVAAALIRVAKQRAIPVILVGHVTKDGAIAGPRTLEHLVDVVISFEGESHSSLRLVRAIKNRFGPADEIGCFELADDGIREVPDPSGIFTAAHVEPVAGSAITVAMEGRRPLISELQALVASSHLQSPRRVSNGLDSARLAMVLAVLQRRAGVRCHQLDVYASTVGGARIFDPGVDLALACALASACLDRHLHEHTIVICEIGLAGEIRRVRNIEQRLLEAARLGVTTAVIPQGAPTSARLAKPLQIIETPTLTYALNILNLK